ncbi:Lrp/AsnC family transcriptional regulator [Candidatus Micrarchaeota archaeon]|nr:Lrp/AsnC family transcriptional regulator [Candidatus Micrarchaeota archaeon]
MRIDKIDEGIIRLLRENARHSNTFIALQLGVSEASVRKRITALTQEKIIRKFTVVTDEEKLALNALVFVSVASGTPTEEVSRKIKSVKCVDKLYEVTGPQDVCVLVKANSIDQINTAVDEIRHISQVTNTETKMILKIYD